MTRSPTTPNGAPRHGPEFQVNGPTTLYRLWPGIAFENGIRHSTEHGPSNARSANYVSATFLYRQSKPRLVRTDGFDVADATAAATHGLEGSHEDASLASAFEGADATSSTMTVQTYKTTVRFRLAIDPTNEGVEVRRRFARTTSSQATMLVDGVRITAIANVGPVSSSRSWAEHDVFVPPQVTRGKSTITVEYAVAAPSEFDAARFEAFLVVR